MMMMERKEGEAFLLVDDDVNDAAFVIRCLRKAKVINPLHWVTTGEEALEYLNGTGKYGNREVYPLPALVLLDLKLPGMSGFDVLARLRSNPAFQGLRVVILTTSSAPADVTRAYQFGANSYLVKSLDFERFLEITSALGGAWRWCSAPPEKASRAEAPDTAVGAARLEVLDSGLPTSNRGRSQGGKLAGEFDGFHAGDANAQ